MSTKQMMRFECAMCRTWWSNKGLEPGSPLETREELPGNTCLDCRGGNLGDKGGL